MVGWSCFERWLFDLFGVFVQLFFHYYNLNHCKIASIKKIIYILDIFWDRNVLVCRCAAHLAY